MPLYRHLADTALVSARLYDEYLPDAAKRDIALALNSEDDARTLAIFLAGIHDLGKSSPVFLASEDDYVNELNDAFMGKNGLHVPRGLDRSLIRHEVISAILIKRFLLEEGVSEAVADSCAIVVGSHHGNPLSHELLASCIGREDIIGTSDPAWLAVQREIFDYAAVISGANKSFINWRDMEMSRSAETILMGFVVAADWGASQGFGCNMSLKSKTLDIDVKKDTSRAVVALNALPIPSKWTPSVPPNAGSEFFHTRFGFPPRPVQKAALDAVRPMTDSGLIIIEAPMGEGKTEAALAVAEVMAQQTGASGVFVALPTIATSDAIFSRARSWVSNLPGSRSGMSMYLSHSRSGLNGNFAELLDAAREEGVDGGHVNRWLSQGTKLGPLSNFVVGTIDQVLVSALASRHVTLRHLALANKVVILDEVHAYDAYMNVFLARALQWLGYYGVPVVLLSATLPTDIRKDLVVAYNDGLNSRRTMSAPVKELPLTLDITKIAKSKQSRNDIGGIDLKPLTTIRYPLISVLDKKGVHVHHTEGASSKNPLALNVLPGGGNDETLAKRLSDRLIHGGCIGIFRNTVARSQQTYDAMKAYFAEQEIPVEVLLLHSRFIGLDRAVKEQRLNNYLGKEFAKRPKRLIVVGTQVMEQSLDIDFDESISDIAPIDSLLQRAGRTHRHNIPNRPRVFTEPRLYIAGVSNWDEEEGGVPGVNHAAEAIYPLKTLYRAVHALRPYALDDEKRLQLPRDISALVRRGYGDRVRPPESWKDEWKVAEKEWRDLIKDKRDKADSNYLLPAPETDILDWQSHISKGVGDSESKALASVRDIDDEEEIILLKSNGKGQIQTLDGEFAGAGLAVDFESKPNHETALAIAASMLRLRAKEFAALDAESVLFDTDLIGEWKAIPILRHKKILVLRENMVINGKGFAVQYSHDRGLEMKVVK
jgi:CRISPR-associated helicase Cas3/CRISPR-associated endonuclease Cas3-HD